MSRAVPDTAALRRAALQASWQRGRWVARRRLIWRWTTWALVRVVLPGTLLIGFLAVAGPWWHDFPDDTPAWMSTTPPSMASASAPRGPAPASSPLNRAAATAATPTDAPVAKPGGLGLRMDLALPAPPPQTASKPSPTKNVGDPRP